LNTKTELPPCSHGETCRECDLGRCAHDVPGRVNPRPARYRCRTCGAILRLDGAVECGAPVVTDDVFDLTAAREQREMEW
jgi:hypothetical protein